MSWGFIKEVVDLERKLYSADPVQHRGRLSIVLLHYAEFAKQLSHLEIALAASLEVVALHRSAFEEDGKANLKSFAYQLMDHAKFVEGMEAWQEALAAVEEALPLWRRLDSENPHKHRGYLVEVLQRLFVLAWDLNWVGRALATMVELLQAMRELMLWEPGKYEAIFRNHSDAFVAILETVEDDFPQYKNLRFS